MNYPIVPACRICTSVPDDIRNQIDEKILLDVPDKEILAEFKFSFPATSPLTLDAIAFHKQHLYKTIALTKLKDLELERTPVVIPESSLKESEILEKTYSDVSQGIINEAQMLESLIIGAYGDIRQLEEMVSANYSKPALVRLYIVTKDTIRKSLMDALQRSQELRQKEGGEIDKERALRQLSERFVQVIHATLQEYGLSVEELKHFGFLLKKNCLDDEIIKKYIQ